MGDKLETDIAGACAARIRGVLIHSALSDPREAPSALPEGQDTRPEGIIKSLAELPRVVGSW